MADVYIYVKVPVFLGHCGRISVDFNVGGTQVTGDLRWNGSASGHRCASTVGKTCSLVAAPSQSAGEPTTSETAVRHFDGTQTVQYKVRSSEDRCYCADAAGRSRHPLTAVEALANMCGPIANRSRPALHPSALRQSKRQASVEDSRRHLPLQCCQRSPPLLSAPFRLLNQLRAQQRQAPVAPRPRHLPDPNYRLSAKHAFSSTFPTCWSQRRR